MIPAFRSEAQFQASILDCASKLGYRTYHNPDSRRSTSGWPDIVLCKPPRLIFLELKTMKGRVRDEQYAWIEALRECGVEARIVRPDSYNDVLALLAG